MTKISKKELKKKSTIRPGLILDELVYVIIELMYKISIKNNRLDTKYFGDFGETYSKAIKEQ